MTLQVHNPTLHVLAFAPLVPGASGPDDGLARTWAAASALGIAEPAPGLDRPVALPIELPQDDVWFRVVAAKADADGRDTAIAFTAHDVAAVAVRLRPMMPSANDGGALSDLARRWRDVAGDDAVAGLFGAAHIFTGATDQPALTLVTDAADMAQKVLVGHAGAGLELSSVVEPGIALWDLETAWGRSVVLLAGREGAATVDDWCWLTGANDDAGRLVRYLMHASKLRFEIGVFQRGIADLREQERKLDTGLSELFALHERFESSGPAVRELIDAQSQLGRAQGDATGLLISITHLRDLRQTVSIAAHNLRAHAPIPFDGAPVTMSPFEREFGLAEWLDGRVAHEVAYLESCRERVGEAQALTDLRLKQLAATHARTANWLTVLQTSVLGALLGTFGVASALGGSFSVATSVRAAVMTLVASMALILPPLAVRWPHGYGWPELTGVAVVGAATGWVVVAAVSSNVVLVVALGAAALGAMTLAIAASLTNGRKRSERRSPRRRSG